jgi:hypothetical protein
VAVVEEIGLETFTQVADPQAIDCLGEAAARFRRPLVSGQMIELVFGYFSSIPKQLALLRGSDRLVADFVRKSDKSGLGWDSGRTWREGGFHFGALYSTRGLVSTSAGRALHDLESILGLPR